MESSSASDRGLVRANNEDAVLDRPDASLWAVADGMGGHAAGEIASRLAIEALERDLNENPPRSGGLVDWLRRSFTSANSAIRAHGKAIAETRGMGTTLTVFAASNAARGIIAHVGDSRAYLLRSGEIEQLTRDHTWVQERIDAGLLTATQAREHPFASVLTRVLGMDSAVTPDVIEVQIEPDDRILLCSDGLTGMVPIEDIIGVINTDAPLDSVVGALVDAAKSKGGLDNISIVILRAR
ncbi:MAG: Stp1/IreP family PP2C-type Ser/Thr phosphatase [Longimicrobiales bacterium]